MDNCLVTKLRGVVNGGNLQKLGVLKCALKTYDNGVLQANQNARPASGKSLEITILSDGVTIIGASNGATMIDSKHGKVSSSWNSTLQLSGASSGDIINVEVSQKYDLSELHCSNKLGFDLEEIKYCTLIDSLMASTVSNTSENLIRGDIANLSNMTSLTILRIGWNPQIYGDIASLGALTSITDIGIASEGASEGKNGIIGNFADFVSSQRAYGRTSCNSLTIKQADYVYVGFGNVDRPRFYDNSATVDAILKWDASHITYVCASKERVYLIGYTQTEINTMIAAGGVYEGYTAIKCD